MRVNVKTYDGSYDFVEAPYIFIVEKEDGTATVYGSDSKESAEQNRYCQFISRVISYRATQTETEKSS